MIENKAISLSSIIKLIWVLIIFTDIYYLMGLIKIKLRCLFWRVYVCRADRKSRAISGPTNFSHIAHIGSNQGMPNLMDLATARVCIVQSAVFMERYFWCIFLFPAPVLHWELIFLCVLKNVCTKCQSI